MKKTIILASSSPYRRQILTRIGLPFEWCAPSVDETPRVRESAAALVQRLAAAKARAVAGRYPRALIIGADQVAAHEGEIMGKPGGHAAAAAQLARMSGGEVMLYAAVALYNAATDVMQSAVETYAVQFRALDSAQIERYLRAEQPYDCCGSLKAEGPGIALLKRLRGDDPNALIGLAVIRLLDMLKNEGVELV